MNIICPFVLRLGPIIIKKPNLLATTFTVSFSHFLKIETSENNAQVWWSALTNQITLCKPSGCLKMAESFRLSTGELFNQVCFFHRRRFFSLMQLANPFKFNWAQLLPTVRRSQTMKRSCEDTLVRLDWWLLHFLFQTSLRMYYVCRCLET